MRTTLLPLGLAFFLGSAFSLSACDSANPADSAVTTGPVVAGAGIAGAIFTTDGTCGGTNVNTFPSKPDVFVDGGPRRTGSAGLPDGTYWVQVTTPSGNVLGRSASANVTVTGGEFVGPCYNLHANLMSASSGYTATGFDDTDNGGGEYKVWISTSNAFNPSESKTDNFKVGLDIPPPPDGTLEVQKFYDANANGTWDSGETAITGWLVDIDNGIGDQLTPYSATVPYGTYGVLEFAPVETNWVHSTPTTGSATVGEADPSGYVEFGNVCLGAGGGHTIGFWRNSNGMALINSGGGNVNTRLAGYTLRNQAGTSVAPFGGSASARDNAWKAWLQSANANNMAYMLSAQMAAMVLNTQLNNANPSALVYAPALIGSPANETLLGFITIADLLSASNTVLANAGNAVMLSAHAQRAYATALKDALDRGNNNLSFVQPTACPFSFAPLP